jgi:hypothetical protein
VSHYGYPNNLLSILHAAQAYVEAVIEAPEGYQHSTARLLLK